MNLKIWLPAVLILSLVGVVIYSTKTEKEIKSRFANTSLPTDISITRNLRNEMNREALNGMARTKQFSNYEEWYSKEKTSITEEELNLFYINNRPDRSIIGDVEAISVYRKEILNRIAWKILFESTNISYEIFSKNSKSKLLEQIQWESSPYLGTELASLIIVEFTDFQCYYCAKSQAVKKAILNKHQNIKWVFKHFPLQEIHDNAYLAHIGASCAFRIDRKIFWNYYDLLFTNHRNLEKDNLLKYAKTAGLDIASWKACMNDPIEKKKIIEEIDNDLAEGRKIGIMGTPVFLVGNQIVKGFHSLPEFEKIVQQELKNLTENYR